MGVVVVATAVDGVRVAVAVPAVTVAVAVAVTMSVAVAAVADLLGYFLGDLEIRAEVILLSSPAYLNECECLI